MKRRVTNLLIVVGYLALLAALWLLLPGGK